MVSLIFGATGIAAFGTVGVAAAATLTGLLVCDDDPAPLVAVSVQV